MEQPFAYICTLTRVEERVDNVQKNIIPYLEEGHYAVWPAVDGCTDDLEKFYQDNKEDVKHMRMAVNNYRSHPRTGLAILYTLAAVLKDAKTKQLPCAIRFEDDVRLSPDFYDKLSILLKQLPSDSDFFKFYYSHIETPVPADWNQTTLLEPFPKQFCPKMWGSDCIYFTQKGINNVLNALLQRSRDLDEFFYYGNLEGRFKGYVTNVNDLCHHFGGQFCKTETSCNERLAVKARGLCQSTKLPYDN